MIQIFEKTKEKILIKELESENFFERNIDYKKIIHEKSNNIFYEKILFNKYYVIKYLIGFFHIEYYLVQDLKTENYFLMKVSDKRNEEISFERNFFWKVTDIEEYFFNKKLYSFKSYYSGEILIKYIKEESYLEEKNLIYIGFQLIQIVEFIMENEIFEMSPELINPFNIFIAENNQIFFIDTQICFNKFKLPNIKSQKYIFYIGILLCESIIGEALVSLEKIEKVKRYVSFDLYILLLRALLFDKLKGFNSIKSFKKGLLKLLIKY